MIFRDILYASLAAEADGAELVGLTVQPDLPELGLTGKAILTDIQTTPEIEAPIDYQARRSEIERLPIDEIDRAAQLAHLATEESRAIRKSNFQ